MAFAFVANITAGGCLQIVLVYRIRFRDCVKVAGPFVIQPMKLDSTR